jgi:CheY-like chemotaxis protein
VAVVDVSMPGMGGPDFIELLMEAYPQTKPIILSGFSRDIVVEDILTEKLRESDVPVLEKPVSQFSVLVEAIQKAATGRGG